MLSVSPANSRANKIIIIIIIEKEGGKKRQKENGDKGI